MTLIFYASSSRQVDPFLIGFLLTSNDQIYHEDEADRDNGPLPDEDEERCVAEDPEEDIWEDKGDDSLGVNDTQIDSIQYLNFAKK